MTKEQLAEQLHVWYLEASKELNPDNYNPKAQKPYQELNEEQKELDRYIAGKILSELGRKKNVKKMSKSQFAEFWQAYPRKMKRKVAERKYLLLDKRLHDKILSALEEFKDTEEWQEEGGQYIPHPSTWLNQERWEDELETSVSEPGAGLKLY